MDKKLSLIILGILIFVIAGLAYLNFFVIGKQTRPPEKSLSPGAPSPNPTLEVLREEINKVKNEGGIVPFDYEVTSINGSEAVINGLRGEMKITNSPLVSFFKKDGEQVTPVSFFELAVGQKLVLEKSPPPAREIKIFILAE